MGYFLWKLVGAIFMDRDSLSGKVKISLGRVFLVVVMIISTLVWTGVVDGGQIVSGGIGVGGNDQEIPSSMLTTLLALLGYVFGSKVSDGVQSHIVAKESQVLTKNMPTPLVEEEERILKSQIISSENQIIPKSR